MIAGSWRFWRKRAGLWLLAGLVSSWLFASGVGAFAQTEPVTQTLLQQGIERYDQGQFTAAIEAWQQAQTAFVRQDNRLAQAYVLNNLAQAYQQLAQWPAAEAALAQSQAQLDSLAALSESDAWEVQAKVLNTQGQLQWRDGQPEQALASWQQAADYYQQAGTSAGALIAQLNQAQALQTLGLNRRALQLLQQTYQALPSATGPLRAAGLRQLGIAYAQVGALARSQQILEASLAQAATPETQLALGNTARARSHRAAATGQRQTALAYGEMALQHYQRAAQSDSALLSVQARLNQLSYLIETGRLAAAADWRALATRLAALPAGQPALFAQLSYAHSLTCLAWPVGCVRPEWSDGSAIPAAAERPTAAQIAQLLAAARQQAQQQQDIGLVSNATGQLGHLYELTQQWSEAEALTQQALWLIEGQQLPELAYRWEWQLGRIYQATNRGDAIAAYERALGALKEVRDSLLQVDAQTQFSFRDYVEPVYREFLEVLLSPTSQQPLASAVLKQAIQVLDALQLTELENFLGCNLARLVNISETSVDPAAVKLYPIILSEQLLVIYEIPGQPLAYYTTQVPQPQVEARLRSLRRDLTLPGKTPQVIAQAAEVYHWLITPLEAVLAAQPQIDTLVFVPDGLLRNLPMGILYDGERYLIEKGYAIAIAPQIELFQPRAAARLNIFRGGISLPQQIRGEVFPPIEQVRKELEQIPAAFTSAPPLLDEAFTEANIEQRLQNDDVSAIHWKTHGVFSSDPSNTYLVAYQDSITANELNALLQQLGQRDPLELMVLSACETALGDRRAVLGLAGVAVRAGARSTLSTLWRADDDANTQLMTQFYQALLQPGTTKAKALQQAQQWLLSEAGYPAPYYWGTYVLVGNWR
ncbi:MAG: CHAT domain-containing protein [Leptolyngbya sp. SIO4C1]|nr:CHAT domain-containing protein [Leptolyngbya sp. SIO4C1]